MEEKKTRSNQNIKSKGKQAKSQKKTSSFGYLKRGVQYGAITLVVAFLMGGIFGIFHLQPLQPAMAFASLTGVIVFLNMILAILLIVFWFLVYIFLRRKFVIPKYFLTSMGFTVVYFLFFGLLKITNGYLF